MPGQDARPRPRTTRRPSALLLGAALGVTLAHPPRAARGAPPQVGAVHVLAGDDATVSALDGGLGLRFDDARNDLAAVTARYVREVGDAPGLLVLFTTFPDYGLGGPAYFVPIANAVEGTGLGPLDRRAAFGVDRLEGLIDMKTLELHPPERFDLDLAHEVAHRHLAYMSARTATAAAARPLTGRQGAHWHAALHTDASLLGGYAWRATSGGRWVVAEREARFSDLDLYGLGLLAAEEVEPFFFLDRLRTLEGAPLPASAALSPGQLALGDAVPLDAFDVARALGPRAPDARSAPTTTHLVFAVLTAPGESATSTRALAVAAELDRRRAGFEDAWASLTRGLGAVTTTREAALGAGPPRIPDEAPSCACASGRASGARPLAAALAALCSCGILGRAGVGRAQGRDRRGGRAGRLARRARS